MNRVKDSIKQMETGLNDIVSAVGVIPELADDTTIQALLVIQDSLDTLKERVGY